MIIDYVDRQLTRRRQVKNGLRYRDEFTPTYQKFLRLCRQVAIEGLERAGLVQVHLRPGDNGANSRSTVYRLNYGGSA